MTELDYYRILGLAKGSTTEEIKKAYRMKARMYHPDINPTPEARDMFILATEAYEFLISSAARKNEEDEAYRKFMNDWSRYRQEKVRHKARVYARTSYSKFRNTDFYKTTRIYDGTSAVFALLIAILVLVYAIVGYIYRINHPLPGFEPPKVSALVIFLILGMVLFVFSIVILKIYLQSSKRKKR
ncbi:MAG: DnaJ domain-containing protein [Bacteroidales bacterium]